MIPEFAFGRHLGETTNNTEIVSVLSEAAKAVYDIDVFQKVRDIYLTQGSQINDMVADRYLRRGEFGELILHLLLRDFHETIPLLSKIYFRDSFGAPVHGFDAVHIQPDNKSLWLGEAKLYTDGKRGVEALIEDIKTHILSDYLNNEFAIITRKIKGDNSISEKDYWIDLMQSSTKLKDQLSSITLPLLCVYESNLFSLYNDENVQQFILDFDNEIALLQSYFNNKNDHMLKNQLNIVLLLFPVRSKKELVARLHHNLSLMQSLGEC